MCPEVTRTTSALKLAQECEGPFFDSRAMIASTVFGFGVIRRPPIRQKRRSLQNMVLIALWVPGSGVKWFNLEDPDGNQVFLVQA